MEIKTLIGHAQIKLTKQQFKKFNDLEEGIDKKSFIENQFPPESRILEDKNGTKYCYINIHQQLEDKTYEKSQDLIVRGVKNINYLLIMIKNNRPIKVVFTREEKNTTIFFNVKAIQDMGNMEKLSKIYSMHYQNVPDTMKQTTLNDNQVTDQMTEEFIQKLEKIYFYWNDNNILTKLMYGEIQSIPTDSINETSIVTLKENEMSVLIEIIKFKGIDINDLSLTNYINKQIKEREHKGTL